MKWARFRYLKSMVDASVSQAILGWLAETHGVFGPTGSAEAYETMRWLLFDNHRFTGSFAAHRVLQSMTPEPPHPDVLAYVRARAHGALSIVERHLADRRFMQGDRPTIVDFSLVGYLYYPTEETGFDLRTAFPTIDAWRGRIAALPGWKPPYEMMPVGRSLPVFRTASAQTKTAPSCDGAVPLGP